MEQEHAGAPALVAFTEAQRQQAMARFAVLRPHLHEGIPVSAVACTAGVPLRSGQRWLARYRAAGLGGLARAPRSDTGQRKLPAALVQVIEGMALRTPRPSIAAMHRRVTALATQHHWTPPSYGRV
jgi:putative transposase